MFREVLDAGVGVGDEARLHRVAGQRLLQQPAAPEEAAHHRAHRHLQHVGDLPVGEVLKVGQDDHHAEVEGEGIDRLEHVLGEDPVEVPALGIGGGVGGVAGDQLPLHRLLLRPVHQRPLLGAPAVAVDEGVGQDLEQPGLDVGAPLEALEEPVGPQQRVLHQVLGVALVPRQPDGGAVERVEVAERQPLELVAGQVVLAVVEKAHSSSSTRRLGGRFPSAYGAPRRSTVRRTIACDLAPSVETRTNIAGSRRWCRLARRRPVRPGSRPGASGLRSPVLCLAAPMPKLIFADDQGVVYDHPELLAAVRTGDDLMAPPERPLALPEGATLAMLPGRRPVGIDPATGQLATLDEVKVGRRRFVPHAVGATLPPGFTRTFLPAVARPALAVSSARPSSRSGPTPPPRRPPAASWPGRSAPIAAPTGAPPATRRPTSRPGSAARLAATPNPIYRQLSRCALEWRCFTAQNTFYGRDEGAIPSSARCNAACVGCLSEQAEGMPPSSHERITRPPTAEEMAEVAVHHLTTARGKVMVSFGQGCEGEPLLRWKEIARAIRLSPRPHLGAAPSTPTPTARCPTRSARSATPASTRSASRSTAPRPTSTRPTTGPPATASDDVVRSVETRPGGAAPTWRSTSSPSPA